MSTAVFMCVRVHACVHLSHYKTKQNVYHIQERLCYSIYQLLIT